MSSANALPPVGPAQNRVDGRQKITGAARYAADWRPDGLVYAYQVLSTIANGRVVSLDTDAAERAPGVLAVLTHRNAPRVDAKPAKEMDRELLVLQDDAVRYDRQPIALVVADTFARAKDAASMIGVRYETSPPRTRLSQAVLYVPDKIMGKPSETVRGDAAAALQASPVRIDAVYTTPVEHHNPMEPHATIAAWSGDRLTVYDATQGVIPARARLAGVFGIPLEDVHVIDSFTGGGFGCKGSTWSHSVLAAMAAKVTGRPVQLALWRPQMWGSVGFRPPTRQHVALGADRDGRLRAQIHETTSQTSMFDEFVEPSGTVTTMLYPSPALRVTHELARTNFGTPTFMRAPGESTGSFALESAMDELAYAVNLDPIELRLRNYADSDPTRDVPFSSKSLRECYRRGAAAFGWSERTPEPRSMRDGRFLIGMGMASSTYPTNRSKAAATAEIRADGTARLRSAGVDIGTGAYTTFALIAAETLGLPIERVTFELGDSTYPEAPVAGGSQLTASLGSAARLAALDARTRMIALAVADARSPVHGADPEAVAVEDGRLFITGSPQRGETIVTLLERNGGTPVAGSAEAEPGPEMDTYSMHAFGAQFAMVRVDPETGTVRLVKQIGAFASGRIINAKTARSQYLGGMVFGVGMALLEESRADLRTGRFMNANLGEYLVPVHADMGVMDALIVEEDDPHVNPIGVKGIGEIGIVGAAAAIANAVYHATGTRVRDLPIRPEKLLV
jgi:xanthine dehydrogenase YagR molybdenum-binding subunit